MHAASSKEAAAARRRNERSERVERAFEGLVLVAALLVVPVIAVEQSSVGEPPRTVAAKPSLNPKLRARIRRGWELGAFAAMCER